MLSIKGKGTYGRIAGSQLAAATHRLFRFVLVRSSCTGGDNIHQ